MAAERAAPHMEPPARIRRADERGRSTYDWLDSRHSFSFAHYYDPQHMGIGPLRVLNDDRVAPGRGFGPHPHRDMEILSYVLSGALAHRDSQGHGGIVNAGEAQFMRAGTGVVHSEMNASTKEPVTFLQVWLTPRERGLTPAYDQMQVDLGAAGTWMTIASGDADGIRLAQDATMRTGRFPAGESIHLAPVSGRQLYLFVISGSLRLDAERLNARDALHLRNGRLLALCEEESHLLLFDLPSA
jgi:quercetin 2,3-dioxygenase